MIFDVYFAICKGCHSSILISLGRPSKVKECRSCGGEYHPIMQTKDNVPLIWIDAELGDELELNFEQQESPL